ncbi:MAG: hypothetical protein PF482_17940 [Desulfobacteraceae bacterium]|nr:hypothetical protein [Desulfobacteraceae bacterium]
MTNFAVKRIGSARHSLARTSSSRQPTNISGSIRWLGMMVFLLLAAPKLRIMIGPAPLYAIDGAIALLLLAANRMPIVKWSALKPFPTLVSFYLMLIFVGEFRGLVVYGRLLESVYMLGEFTLGVSLFFIVPRLVRDTEAGTVVLKAIVAGLLCCCAVTIMYSLAPTRTFVMNTVFSYDFLVPNSESLARRTLYYGGLTEAMRGQSLIGTSTITTGFLGTMWAFTFLAANWPGIEGKWLKIVHITAIATPIAMLMTYGRAAWLTVIAIGTMSIVFGFAKSRRNTAILVIGLAIVFFKVGWQSELFMVDRVFEKTQLVIENPYEEESFAHRLRSFTQPFSHLLDNPIWLVAGAGRVGQKLSNRGNVESELRDQAGLSKHSGFGMAYYCYGLLAAVTHVLIMLNGLRLILKRLQGPAPNDLPLYKITWQAFLMAWVGLLFWWLPGHAMVGEARGVILFFFFYGFMMSCDRMLAVQVNEVVLE